LDQAEHHPRRQDRSDARLARLVGALAMKRVLGYGLLGLPMLLLLGALLIPARLVVDQLERHLPNISVQAVDGTAIAGSAQELRWRSARLERLSWDWQPLALLHGWLEFKVDTGNSAVKLLGNVAMGWQRQWRFQDLVGRLSIAQAGALLGKTPPLDGTIEFRLGDLHLNAAGQPQAAHGVARLRQLRVLLDQPLDLGDFTLRLTPATPTGVQGAIQDSGGPLVLTGVFNLLPDGRYHVAGQAAVRDPSNRALAQAMNRVLGPPGDDGHWPLNFTSVLAL